MATKSGITPAHLRADYLLGMVSHLKQVSALSDTFLENKIREAEDDLERDLNLYLATKIIRSEPKPGDTGYDLAEPAYDYETEFFAGERWGWVRLRRYPIQSVQRMVFAFPSLDSTVFTVPSSWIKVDDAFGLVRLVPTQAAVWASFTGYLFSLLAGGHSLPQSLFVDYTAGFKSGELASNHQDILEHLKQGAVLGLLEAAFTPGSLSTSADGISQSVSFEVKTYREGWQAKRAQLRNKLKGIRLTVC